MKILIVDAYPIVILGYRALFAAPDFEVVAGQDAESACQTFKDERPGITLVDFHLPQLSGLELLRRLLLADPRASIIMIGAASDPLFAAQSLDAGAKGFLAKSEEPDVILQSVREVIEGGVAIAPALAKRMVELRSREGEALLRLTPREREILRLLSIGRNMAEIADVINLSYKTVAVSCNRLREKLHARTTVELVHVASLLGLL